MFSTLFLFFVAPSTNILKKFLRFEFARSEKLRFVSMLVLVHLAHFHYIVPYMFFVLTTKNSIFRCDANACHTRTFYLARTISTTLSYLFANEKSLFIDHIVFNKSVRFICTRRTLIPIRIVTCIILKCEISTMLHSICYNLINSHLSYTTKFIEV